MMTLYIAFSNMDFRGSENGKSNALNTISASGGRLSSIGDLGCGLPLSRAYANCFGGDTQFKVFGDRTQMST